MKLTSSICLVVLNAALFSGCASTPANVPKHPMTATADSATLIGKAPLMYLSTTLNDIAFVEVDGAVVPWSSWNGAPKRVPVSPGKHIITVYLAGYAYVEAQERIELECKPKHSYRFLARKVGLEFDLSVHEEPPGATEGEGTVVLNQRIGGTRGAAPVAIPIFIPSGR